MKRDTPCMLSVLRLSCSSEIAFVGHCRLPFWRDEDDMRMTSLTDVRSAVDEGIPLDYGPWLRASPQCRDFVDRLLQVGDRSTLATNPHHMSIVMLRNAHCNVWARWLFALTAMRLSAYETQYQGCACVRC